MCQIAVIQPYSSCFARGQTPSHAYLSGKILFNVLLNKWPMEMIRYAFWMHFMIFSAGQSPLYILCRNYTYSVTWTGADDNNQVIFECKAPGLTGSLCCCICRINQFYCSSFKQLDVNRSNFVSINHVLESQAVTENTIFRCWFGYARIWYGTRTIR